MYETYSIIESYIILKLVICPHYKCYIKHLDETPRFYILPVDKLAINPRHKTNNPAAVTSKPD